MPSESLTVALVSEVFVNDDAQQRLCNRLGEAKSLGAQFVVLPELPLNRWSPATKRSVADDAEPPGGRRCNILSSAAREVSIALLGGAIVRNPVTGQRLNTALVFDAAGNLVASYAKLHIPQEPGFWETSHYEPGCNPPSVIHLRGVAIPFGIQICSDVNRPQGTHILAALGAEAILVPRASEKATYEQWRIVFQANAITAASYILSVNRPWPEQGIAIGGPSIAVGPGGEIILETTDRIAVATLNRDVVRQARRAYPGYLPTRSPLYAEAWAAAARR